MQNDQNVVVETVERNDSYTGESFLNNVLKPLLTSPMFAMVVSWKCKGKKVISKTSTSRNTNMSSRLEQVVQRVSTLPIEIQDEIAEQWFEDIENEIGWQRTLQQPQDKLSKLAKEALLQSSQGKTLVKGFDEI